MRNRKRAITQKRTARTASVNERIRRLLNAIRDDFPRFKRAVVQGSRYPDETAEVMKFVLSPPPRRLGRVPTFEVGVFRKLTPMLEARFEYAGRIRRGLDIWLSLRQMSTWMRKQELRGHHRSRRTWWINSPPNLHPDSRLSLFGVTDGVPQNAIYLVWGDEGDEPRVWSCSLMDADEFDSLEEYLRWHLGNIE
jgi:hypothetical protein